MFEVTRELDWEQGGREGHWGAIVNDLINEVVQVVVFAGGFCFPFMLSKGWHL